MNKCFDYADIAIQVTEKRGECRHNYQVSDIFVANDIFPMDICPGLYHTLIPYYLTFINGGVFAWAKPRNSVAIQCPDPDVSVVARINNLDKKAVLLKIESRKKDCPFGMKEGQTFILKKGKSSFCLKALDALFPYINDIASLKPDGVNNKIKVSCPGYPNNIVFEISYSGNAKT